MNYFIYNSDTGFVKAKTDNVEIRDGLLSDRPELTYIESESEAEHDEVKVENGVLITDTIQITQAKANAVRQERNRLLAETDWKALTDAVLTTQWAEYRQALRDITNQPGFPTTVIWPEMP